MEKVARVIDGDSFETESGQEICLWGVDAPDVDDPAYDRAAEKLQILLSGKSGKSPAPIYYGVPPKSGQRGGVWVTPKALSFGRIVAEITVNGKSVNNAMKRFIKNAERQSARAG